MDIKQLTYFVAVADHGSFSRAALELGVAQPALSRQIRNLEVGLRHTLLRRHGRGAVPTEAGQLLLEHARGILHQIHRCTEALSEMQQALGGRVAVGLPPSLARMLTVPFMRGIASQLPQAQVSIGEGLSAALLTQVQHGRLDVALVYDAHAWPEVAIKPLLNEALVLVGKRAPGLAQDPPDGAVSLAEIAQVPLVIPRRPNAIRQSVEQRLGARGLSLNVALEVDGVSAILDLVADGAGSALLPPNAVFSCIKPSDFVTRRVEGAALDVPVMVATSGRRTMTSTQMAALALLCDTARVVLEGA